MFRYSSRFWLYAPIGLFLLIAAAVMLHWWAVAGAYEKRLAALKGKEAVPGITLDWDSVTVGGFPFRLDTDFTNLSARGVGAHGPFYWRSEKFALHALTYGRATTVMEAAGRQRLRWAGRDGEDHAAEFVPGTLHASSTTDARGLLRFDLDIVDAGLPGFTAQRLQFHLRRDPDGKDLDLMVEGANVTMAGPDALPPRFEAYVTLTGAAPLMPLLAGKSYWTQAVQAWTAQGGEVHVTKGEATPALMRALAALF